MRISREGVLFWIICKTLGNHRHHQVQVPVNCIRGFLLSPSLHGKLQLHVCAPADCSTPCSSQAHMDLCMVAFLCHTGAMWHWSQRHARAHWVPQYSKAANASIYRQPQDSWCHARICILDRVGFPIQDTINFPAQERKHIMKTGGCQIQNSFVGMGRGTDSDIGTNFSTSADHTEGRAARYGKKN